MVKQKMSLSSELNAPVQLIPLLNLYLFEGQGSILHMGLLFVYQGLRVPERNGSSASRDLVAAVGWTLSSTTTEDAAIAG